MNHSCRIELETDAENQYLVRANDPGSLNVQSASVTTASYRLWNGVLTLTLQPAPHAKPEDRGTVRVTLSTAAPEVPSGWLDESAEILFTGPRGAYNGGNGSRRGGSRAVDLPVIKDVTKDRWDIYQFGDEDAVLIDEDTSSGQVTSFVNVDNKHLKRFCFYKPNQSDTAKVQFRLATTLAGLYCRMLTRQGQLAQDNERDALRVFGALILDVLPLSNLEAVAAES